MVINYLQRKDEEIITDVAGTLVNEFKKQMIADIEVWANVFKYLMP